jgi:predicted Zn-dependent protease
MRRAFSLPLLLLLVLASSHCSINPATGRQQLALMSEAQEIQLGRQEDKKIEAEFGLYLDPEWQRTVSDIGHRMAAVSERPDLPWEFHVIDDPVVNAFALPGGFIYVTRGILAHFNSEAELASVLGHEIGHVTARHSVEQISRQQLAGLGFGIAMAASEDVRQYADLLGAGLQIAFLKFSRDDESQSDDLGLRYMTRAGYHPDEMVKVFHTLGRVSALAGGGRIPEWQSTHPDPVNRAQRIAAAVSQLPPEQRQGTVNRDSYLRQLEGMTFGSDPREGFVSRGFFFHPAMAFKLRIADGWQVLNKRTFVGFIQPDEQAVAVLSLSQASDPAAALDAFFNDTGASRGPSWKPGRAEFRTEATTESPAIRGAVGFIAHDGNVFQILGYTADTQWATYGGPIKQMVNGFRRLSDRRYLDVEPHSLSIVTLDRAMNLRTFHQRYPSAIDLDRLAALNAINPDETLPEGTLVKRVVGKPLP